MAAKDRLSVLLAMMDQGVIPVFYDPDVDVCKNVIQACANGGAKCIEFTNRGDFASHVFLEVTRHFAKVDPSVIMGVGSIVDAPTAGIYIANGAKFVVGPLLNPDVAKVCNRRGIPYSPGCGSATRDRLRAGARVRDREGVPGLLRRRPRLREERDGADAVDAHHADGRRGSDARARFAHGSAPASSPAASAATWSPSSCSTPSDYKGIEEKVRTTVQLVKTIKADLAAKR